MERFSSARKQALVVIAQLACFGVVGCGPETSDRQVDDRHINYNSNDYEFITWWHRDPSVTGIMRHVKNDTINVCLSGVYGDKDKWDRWISSSLLKWIDTLRKLTSSELTKNINVTTTQQNCHVDFRVQDGEWGLTQVTNNPIVWVGPGTPYNVVAHEFGHTFALDDTYYNGQSGNCLSGQPQSLMCNISFDGPQKDDADGVAVVFKRVFPNDKPEPPPEEKPLEASFFMAIEELEDGTGIPHVSVIPKDQNSADGELSYCIGDANTCKTESGPWSEITASDEPVDRPHAARYLIDQKVEFQDGDLVLLRYQLDGKEKVHGFEVNDKKLQRLGML